MKLPECQYQCDCQQCYYAGARCKKTHEYCSVTMLNGRCPEGWTLHGPYPFQASPPSSAEGDAVGSEAEAEPQRELSKYFVLKMRDVWEYLNESEGQQLDELATKITGARRAEGKSTNSYVVFNQDEPYADALWDLIVAFERMKQGSGVAEEPSGRGEGHA